MQPNPLQWPPPGDLHISLDRSIGVTISLDSIHPKNSRMPTPPAPPPCPEPPAIKHVMSAAGFIRIVRIFPSMTCIHSLTRPVGRVRVIDTGLCVASQTLVAPKKAKRLGKAKITYGKNSSEIADWATGSGTHTFWNRLRNNQCEFSHRQNLRIYMQM